MNSLLKKLEADLERFAEMKKEFNAIGNYPYEANTRALLRAIEFIQFVLKQDRTKGYPTGSEWISIIEVAKNDLSQITRILSGEGDEE